MESGENLLVARSPRMSSRLSSIIEQWQKLQPIETKPPVPKRPPRKRTPVQDVVVAVMGVTGAGKSSFIRRVTEDDRVKVGAGLQSTTQSVQPFELRHDGRRYSIVDTPGFNDTDRSDSDVLKELADWLLEYMKGGKKISGIIYLHRICDTRMEGSALRNLRMFRRLCGDDFMKNVVLGTTFWDTVGEEQGAERERELLETDDFFKEMKGQGCHVARISSDRDDNLALLARFAGQPPMVLQVQQELFGGKTLAETAAASAVSHEIVEIQRQNIKMLSDAERQARDKMHRSALEKVLGMHIQRMAFDKTMKELSSEQEGVRREMEEQERRDDERIEVLQAEKLKQEQGFQIQIAELSKQLQALKTNLP